MSRPTLSVVVPAYQVEAYLDECLASVLATQGVALEVVVVDDGSTDGTGDLADAWAARDERVRVVHQANAGLGAARNEGIRHARGRHLGFCDSDDVVPLDAYAVLVGSLEATGSAMATGSVARWTAAGLEEPPWMHRLHHDRRPGIRVEDHPEILGDVFAVNKVWRRDAWDAAGLAWPEGVRYEDQPTTTRAYLSGPFDVLPEVVYHWRVRQDGSSITQQRASVADLTDRWTTKRMAWRSVQEHGDREVTAVFLDRVLAGDLWRYFLEIPTADDEWWRLLREGIGDLWGDRSLVQSGLPPVHRLVGWLVEQDRRPEAESVVRWIRSSDGPAEQLRPGQRRGWLRRYTGPPRLDVPADVLDVSTVDLAALALREHELR